MVVKGINAGMSRERRAAKASRNKANRELRANLHREKSGASMSARQTAQNAIDAISRHAQPKETKQWHKLFFRKSSPSAPNKMVPLLRLWLFFFTLPIT